MTRIRQITVRCTADLDDYRQFDGPSCTVEDLLRLGHEVGALLNSRTVWMLNSTESMGGIAEMMPRLCGLLTMVGVDTRWLVLEPADPAFFEATKALYNMLHGEQGKRSIAEIAPVYAQVSREGAEALRALVTHDDVLVVHNEEAAGVARYLPPKHAPRLAWRSHFGVPHRNPEVIEAWRFLTPYLEAYERLLFSAESYIPDELFARSGVLMPGIDPLSHKNRELRSYKLIGILRSAGLVQGPPLPAWTRFKAPVLRFVEGRWEVKPIEDLLYVPVIAQISRFDRLKGVHYLIPAFARMLDEAPEVVPRLRVDTERALSEAARVQLVLAGPDPDGAAHDPEASGVLSELCAQHSRLPAELRARVHLLRLPLESIRENALIVNALQRLATTIVLNSIQEGFGLTATEALWKETPVVASNVGGLALQIRNATDGLLIQDPTDCEALAGAMLRMFVQTKEREKMARSAHRRVRENFLMTMQARAWLEELRALVSQPSPDGRQKGLVPGSTRPEEALSG